MMTESESLRNQFSTELSLERLKELLEYDPETGLFRRIKAIATRTKIGDLAGSIGNHGYVEIYVQGKLYLAHRLAWFYMTGNWPNEINHINEAKADNRFCNLQNVTSAQNKVFRVPNINNLLQIKGVQERCGKYRAYITVKGSNISLGTYANLQDAIHARQEAEIKYYGSSRAI